MDRWPATTAVLFTVLALLGIGIWSAANIHLWLWLCNSSDWAALGSLVTGIILPMIGMGIWIDLAD